MLKEDVINRIISKFPDKTIIYAGCRVKKINFDYCYNDLVIFPSEISPSIFDEENKVIIYGLQNEKSLFKEDTIPLYDPYFKYNLAVSENKSALIKNITKNSLKESIKHLSEISFFGSISFYASVARLIEPAVVLSGTSLSPSHIFSQINKENSEILKKIFEILQIDSNLGSILKQRAYTLASLMQKNSSIIFLKKIDNLLNNKKDVEASVYFFHELSKLGGNKLQMLSKDFKFGAVEDREKNEALDLVKTLSQKLNDF